MMKDFFQGRYIILFQVGCLLLLYTSGAFVRLAPIENWGVYVTADDPVLHVRLTEYVLENGHLPRMDDLAWYPWGQNWETTLPNFRYYLTAGIYWLFNAMGMGLSLYDFCVFFPAFFAPLAVIPMFLAVREIWDWKSGLVAAGVLVVSSGYLTRTIAGFYRHEHVGIPLLITCIYFFVKGMRADTRRENLIYSVLSGFTLVFLTGTWSGFRFLLDGFAVFIFFMMFTRRLDREMLYCFIITDGLALASTFFWPNLATRFFTKTEFAVPLVIIISALLYEFVLKKRVDRRRIPVITAGMTLVLFLGMLATVSNLPSGRYEVVVNPLRQAPSGDVSQTVAEHAGMRLSWSNGNLEWPALSSYGIFLFLVPLGLILPFYQHSSAQDANRDVLSLLVFSTLLLFLALDPYPALMCYGLVWLGMAGLWYITPEKNRPGNSEFLVMLFALLAAYFFKNMIRLNILFSVFVAVQSGLCFSYGIRFINSRFGKSEEEVSSSSRSRSSRRARRKSKKKKTSKGRDNVFTAEIALSVAIVLLLLWPISGSYKTARGYPLGLREDWFKALDWLEENSQPDDVVMSWWDYGYWIQTYAGRPTIADGATTNSTQIRKIARAFITTESAAHDFCLEYDVRYIVIDVSDDFIGGKWTAMAVIAKQNVGDYMAVDENGQTMILDKGQRCPLFRMASRGLLQQELPPLDGFEYKVSFSGERGGRVIIYEFLG